MHDERYSRLADPSVKYTCKSCGVNKVDPKVDTARGGDPWPQFIGELI